MGAISENFSYREFEKSATADRLEICNVITTVQVRDAVHELTTTILQPLRTAWGSAIIISSGYRCPELNGAVGGSATSAHLTGNAADLVPANGEIDRFQTFAENWLKSTGTAFDQCIRERDGKDRWLHIGLRNNAGQQRRQFLSLVKK